MENKGSGEDGERGWFSGGRGLKRIFDEYTVIKWVRF